MKPYRVSRQKENSPEVIKAAKALDTWIKRHMERNENPDLIEFMERVYKVADLFGGQLKGEAVCQRGCSDCCRLPVDVTTAEASYICQKVGIEIAKVEEFDKYGPCPFLNLLGECKIYEFRPLPCRVFFTMDSPLFCRDPFTSHEVVSVMSSSLTTWLSFMLSGASKGDHGEKEIADIRYWFE